MHRERSSDPGSVAGLPRNAGKSALSVLLVSHNGRGPIAIRRHTDYLKAVTSAQRAFRNALEGVPLSRLYLKARIPGLVEKEAVQISEELWPDIVPVLHSVLLEVEDPIDAPHAISPESSQQSSPPTPVTKSSPTSEDLALAALLDLYPAPRPPSHPTSGAPSNLASQSSNANQRSGPPEPLASTSQLVHSVSRPSSTSLPQTVTASSPSGESSTPLHPPPFAENNLHIPGPAESPVLTIKFIDGAIPPLDIVGVDMKSLTGERVLEIIAARLGLDAEDHCLRSRGGWPIDYDQNLHDYGVSPGDQVYCRRNPRAAI